ncbi:Hypothetical protein ETEE_0097 [Edwardsiella anguillarum ET080813]|uniref:Uncharacterized protein n=1 Tax=Edwardsiella anguillarum ET080813 TaxID=667120 RepID=A0A076LJ46_9GAMM|nr:Hypothetical protein ETEE_0097 [Edwardsiella anguillarum ET080813]
MPLALGWISAFSAHLDKDYLLCAVNVTPKNIPILICVFYCLSRE